MPESPVTLAIAQAETPADTAQALEAAARWAGRAREAGAAVLAFPETWIPGYPAWLDACRDVALWNHAPVKRVFRQMVEQAVEVPGPITARLGEVAGDSGLTLVVGVTERVAAGPGNGTLYNALLIFGPDGQLCNHHRKLMPTYTERLVWGTGDGAGLGAVETPAGRVGGLICWEHWMPLARQAMHQSGEDIHVAVWPWVHEMHQVASRQYAFEGRCFVLAAGALLRAEAMPRELEPDPRQVPADGWVLRGGSAIIGPEGGYLAEPVLDREALVVATVDLGRRREELMTLDVTGHYHRPDVFAFSVDRAARR